MYLLVFVTLMIGILGTYTQVLGLQAARFASGQSSIGSAMLQWHAAAVSMAVSIINTNGPIFPNNAYPGNPATGPGVYGCSLTFKNPPNVAYGGTFNTCPQPTFYGPPKTQTGTVTTGPMAPTLNLLADHKTSKNACVHLADTCNVSTPLLGCNVAAGNCKTNYDLAHYQFYSFLYYDSTSKQDFVVTFLPAPIPSAANPSPGFLSTVPVPGIMLGLTASDLAKQLQNAGVDISAYGFFSGFPATPVLVVSGNTYSLPAGIAGLCTGSTTCQPNGSIAVIGSPDGL